MMLCIVLCRFYTSFVNQFLKILVESWAVAFRSIAEVVFAGIKIFKFTRNFLEGAAL